MNRINKHTFILLLCTALFALAACTSDVDIDNAGNNNSGIPVGTRLTLRATASDFNAPTPSGSDASTRTPVMEGTSTKFQPGDAIGLFCVRRPATGADYISKDIYNLKMTYTETADGTGSWKAPTVESAPLVYTDAVTYFAYYPYTDALTAASVSNEQSIREWLKTNKPLATDMLTLAELAANDLMTATALPSHADDDRGALALNFKHEYALLVVKPMGTNCQCVPPAGVTAYSYHSQAKSDGWGIDRNVVQVGGEDFKMKINNRKACEMTDGTYHILAEPTTTSSQINCDYVTFNDGMQPVTASGSSHSDGFKANTCYTLEVHCSYAIGSIERAIQPGDFVYQHSGKIEIYPGDGAVDANGKIPDYANAVGIVVTTDPTRLTDAECTSYGWTNAYVIGTEFGTDLLAWSSQGFDETVLDNNTTITQAKTNMNGFKETKAMLTEYKTDLSSYPAFNALVQYRATHSTPIGVNRSPWFIPSAGQWFDVFANIGKKSPDNFSLISSTEWSTSQDEAKKIYDTVNAQFYKIGKSISPADNNGTFLCSTEYDTGWIWYFTLTTNRAALTTQEKIPLANKLFPFFAF